MDGYKRKKEKLHKKRPEEGEGEGRGEELKQF